MAPPDGYRTDAVQLRASGDGITSSADALAQRLSAFRSELAGYGEPWGNDDLGTLIGMCYQAIAELAMDCYQDNITEMAADGADVSVMADTYQGAEDSATDIVLGSGEGLF